MSNTTDISLISDEDFIAWLAWGADEETDLIPGSVTSLDNGMCTQAKEDYVPTSRSTSRQILPPVYDSVGRCGLPHVRKSINTQDYRSSQSESKVDVFRYCFQNDHLPAIFECEAEVIKKESVHRCSDGDEKVSIQIPVSLEIHYDTGKHDLTCQHQETRSRGDPKTQETHKIFSAEEESQNETEKSNEKRTLLEEQSDAKMNDITSKEPYGHGGVKLNGKVMETKSQPKVEKSSNIVQHESTGTAIPSTFTNDSQKAEVKQTHVVEIQLKISTDVNEIKSDPKDNVHENCENKSEKNMCSNKIEVNERKHDSAFSQSEIEVNKIISPNAHQTTGNNINNMNHDIETKETKCCKNENANDTKIDMELMNQKHDAIEKETEIIRHKKDTNQTKTMCMKDQEETEVSGREPGMKQSHHQTGMPAHEPDLTDRKSDKIQHKIKAIIDKIKSDIVPILNKVDLNERNSTRIKTQDQGEPKKERKTTLVNGQIGKEMSEKSGKIAENQNKTTRIEKDKKEVKWHKGIELNKPYAYFKSKNQVYRIKLFETI